MPGGRGYMSASDSDSEASSSEEGSEAASHSSGMILAGVHATRAVVHIYHLFLDAPNTMLSRLPAPGTATATLRPAAPKGALKVPHSSGVALTSVL